MIASIFHLDALLVGGLLGALAVTLLKPVILIGVEKLKSLLK